MAISDDTMKVEDSSALVNAIYNTTSIADEDLDKSIFSNNYYKDNTLSVINDHNLSATDASNFNAQNLNSSQVHREDDPTKRMQDETTLASVTRATSGIPLQLAVMYGAELVPPVTPEVTDFIITPESNSIEVGATTTFAVAVIPEDANSEDVVVTSSNTAIFTVSGNVITGVAAGQANLVGKAGDIEKVVSITVTAP